jgi:hypothetical protein
MDTKGKSSRGFYHPIGLKTLTKNNEPLLLVSRYPQKNVNSQKEKRNKKEKSNNSNSIHLLIPENKSKGQEGRLQKRNASIRNDQKVV